MKKPILGLFLLAIFGLCFADQSLDKSQPKNSNELNKPTVGSRQAGSEQLFGTPKLTGKKGEKYHNKTPEGQREPNDPTVGSRQAGSEQIFGTPKGNGKEEHKYPPNQKPLNPSTVGSRQSSDFIFDQDKTK